MYFSIKFHSDIVSLRNYSVLSFFRPAIVFVFVFYTKIYIQQDTLYL